jgi:lysophospholipase L1-like esterase
VTGNIEPDSTVKASGGYSAKLSVTNGGTNAVCKLSQGMILHPNTYYQMRGKFNAYGPNIKLRLINADSSLIKALVDPDPLAGSAFREGVFNFKTPAAPTAWTLAPQIINVANGQGLSVHVDDFSVRPISINQDLVVAAIGDSQVGHLGSDAAMENDMPESWLSASIRSAQRHVNFAAAPLNKGVPGNRSDQVDGRVQADVIDQVPKPAVCYVAVGTNDAAASYDLTTYKGYMSSITQKLLDGGIIPVLLTITPRGDAVDVTPYNAKLAEVASEKNVALLDAYSIFTSYAGWDPNWLDVGDDVHYNSYGHLAIGAALGLILKDLPSTANGQTMV